jgi:predicted ArsR family transcriptional regulator
MDVFTMVVLIVLIAMVGTTVGKLLQARAAAGRGAAEQDARIARLEERVRALETVVTDHGFDLKRELRELERG